jgi:hypothetical protein
VSLFRRRERPVRERDVREPSYAEEEANPELIAAEKAVNALPSVPSSDSVFGVMFGQRPHIVDAPDGFDPSANDVDGVDDGSEPAEDETDK